MSEDKVTIGIYHCTSCHHEWEYCKLNDEPSKCDWCGAEGRKIGQKTYDFGFLQEFFKKALDKID